MKVYVTGTRGFPDIQGGVETHCCQLYTRLAARGLDITVARRKPYLNDANSAPTFEGVSFDDLYAPRSKHFEAIVHTVLATFRARRAGADILHIHGIGPGLVAPLARLLGLKVVLTVHSFNYNHDKWNALAKSVLRLGEWASTRWARRIISISQPIARSLSQRYPRLAVDVIYNGVNPATPTGDRELLHSLGIGDRPYILALGRLTAEKGFHDLVHAYASSGLRDHVDLVIAGEADHESPYTHQLRADAAAAGVIMPGFVKGEQLRQLLSAARLFVLSSYTEGLPIALLEAMSYGLDVLVTDIEPNRLDMLNKGDFVPVGDVKAMAAAIRRKLDMPARRAYDLSAFDWDFIAGRTAMLYDEVING